MKQFRSKFEQVIKKQLDELKMGYEYEPINLDYIIPESKHEYWPDLLLDNGIFIEVKGYLDPDSRKKLELVKKQHPDKDIRIVFQSANNKIYKSSKVTYGDWATRVGFIWAEKIIPTSWLKGGKDNPTDYSSIKDIFIKKEKTTPKQIKIGISQQIYLQ